MDTKKLDRWAESLLDTGKRNPLIHLSDRKPLTVEVLVPEPDALFDRIDGTTAFEVYDPKITEEDDADGGARSGLPSPDAPPEENDPGQITEKAAYLQQYAGKIRKQNQLLLYTPRSNAMAAVKKIDRKAREFIEETGVNVAYMAFGFLHWTESDSPGLTYHAPILLVPIQLEQATGVDPYYVRSTGDDVIVNPTFAYKLNAEYGVTLPDYGEEGLSEYLQKVRKIAGRLHWSVTSECRISIFSFLKINMYRDLKDNAPEILANPNIRRLLGEPVEQGEDGEAPHEEIADPLIELHNVVDADSSQLEAIELAREGKSFVLQGPPGTGKSQTITNIIAECLASGKKVLFVSEKLAALNVVYEKLKQVGLSEFCLELHSHKANKKDVIQDICHTLRTDKSGLSAKAADEIAIKARAERQLDVYAAQLHMKRPVIGRSLYQLYEEYAALRQAADVEWVVPQLETRGEAYLAEALPLLEQYVDYIPSIGYDYRENPWYGYRNQDTSYQTKNQIKTAVGSVLELLDTLIPIQEEICGRYGVGCDGIGDARNWRDFFRLCADSEIITPALLKKEQFDAAAAALDGLRETSAEILSCRSVLDSCYEESVYRIDGKSFLRNLTEKFSSPFARLFGAEYRQMMSQLRACRKDESKPSYPDAVAMMERLASCQQKTREFAELERPVRAYFGSGYTGITSQWDEITAQLETLENILQTGLSLGTLPEAEHFTEEQEAFAQYARQLDEAFSICGAAPLDELEQAFDPEILDPGRAGLRVLRDRLKRCMEEMGKLDNWCHFRKLLSDLRGRGLVSYLDAAIARNVEEKDLVAAFRKLFCYQWIDSILSGSAELSAFSRISQDQAIRTFCEKDREQFEINRAWIRAELSSERPPLDMVAPGSALSVLLREGEKKRRQKSIRTLLEETGELVQKIKPCFLMSPLSVSTYLAADSVRFDVVVFDEASQIFPQDAIGAIYRAKQLIVVGDSRQMPPSNFFNTSVETEEDDEETGDVTDFESILDLCGTSLKQIRLRWHYRSRYEQLIAFSNKNFYDHDLVTFPSAKADAPGVGVDYYHVDGLFDRKAHNNRKEAEFVVDLIYENLGKYPDRSLGVVAFSVAQQDLIDKLLSQRRQNTPEKEAFFRRNPEEPFFVKNLETVQGDERDTIIFSVAYGRDAQGKLLHNFGPLNRVGGERRLNVAVTRAKCNVQLVSSMHHTDIDLKRTSAEGARLLREYLEFAENGAAAPERSAPAGGYEQFDSDLETEVCDFLRSHGFEADKQVGCSGSRIDLGLKRPGSSDYALAIECDGATYHASKNARDRDRLRQEVLERMGWKFYRLWSTDWFRNQEVEKEKLLAAAADAVKNPAPPKEKPAGSGRKETFEVRKAEEAFVFPEYREADVDRLSRRCLPRDFQGFVKEILSVEAPLSEEWLLKRIVWAFDREKVTSAVKQSYEQRMRGCEKNGIIRRNGFLYLDGGPQIRFRRPGNSEREIKQIAPEELAAGMLEILHQNITAEKTGLFRTIALQCGVSRVGKQLAEVLENALQILKDQIQIEGEQISLK